MKSEQLKNENINIKPHKPEKNERTKTNLSDDQKEVTGLASLQQSVGNRAVQRLIAQRSGQGSFELDDATTNRIDNQRGGGQALDGSIQTQMGPATSHDFKDVRVHTSPESDNLNRELGAKAFTTGNDVFFREGQYDPHSSSGQELIAHELTHVVQQNSGRVSGTGKMTVHPPDDVFEQEADTVAKSNLGSITGSEVQRQVETEPGSVEEEEEEESPPEVGDLEEEEEKTIQTQEMEEVEEEI